MSIPPYPAPDSFGAAGGQPSGARPPIKYVWPKRIAVILVGLSLLGGIGFGVKTLLDKDDTAATSQETVQSASPAPAEPQAPPVSGGSQASPAPSGAQAPTAALKLNQAVTDSSGALTGNQIAEVKAAVNSLQTARDVRLWVVYVDAFDAPPVEWARKTRALTRMGDRDALLAVATKQRQYAFLVPPAAANGSEKAVKDLRVTKIEPRLRDNNFAGAAISAATGLQALG